MIFQTKTKTPITPITETERSAFCREETNLETKPLVEETKSKARWQKIPIEYISAWILGCCRKEFDDFNNSEGNLLKSDETVQINEELENKSFDQTSSLIDKNPPHLTEDLNDVNPDIVSLSNENDEDKISETISENKIYNKKT